MKAEVDHFRLVLWYAKSSVFRTKFGHYKYTVMSFRLSNPDKTFQHEIECILGQFISVALLTSAKVQTDYRLH
jgi:hypothetical protein